MTTTPDFLHLLDTYAGILHKITKLYMPTPQDQQDLLQEILCQL